MTGGMRSKVEEMLALVQQAVRCQAALVRQGRLGKVSAAVTTLLPATLVAAVVVALEQLAPMPHL